VAKKSYEGDGIVVHFEARRCIHAAECVRRLPAVFDVGRRPWILADAAPADPIAEIVERCPSGALTYERTDGGRTESVDPVPTIRARRHGPLYLRGSCTVTDHGGAPVEVGPRAALCRCGGSKNKPFCDNSHLERGFRDPDG